MGSAVLVVDIRSGPTLRRLGPIGWAVLVEMALSADTVETDGSLVCPVSARSIASAVGIGREAVARELRSLIDAGLVHRSVRRRMSGGRFGPGAYQLVLPEGMAVSGVAGDRPAVSGRPWPGGPAPALVAAAASDGREVVGIPGPGPGPVVPPGQASLFAAMASTEGSTGGVSQEPPRDGWESVGAAESSCCEVSIGVHELAPVVPPRPGPGPDPSGDSSC